MPDDKAGTFYRRMLDLTCLFNAQEQMQVSRWLSSDPGE